LVCVKLRWYELREVSRECYSNSPRPLAPDRGERVKKALQRPKIRPKIACKPEFDNISARSRQAKTCLKPPLINIAP
jgi:hypothetical protein